MKDLRAMPTRRITVGPRIFPHAWAYTSALSLGVMIGHVYEWFQ